MSEEQQTWLTIEQFDLAAQAHTLPSYITNYSPESLFTQFGDIFIYGAFITMLLAFTEIWGEAEISGL